MDAVTTAPLAQRAQRAAAPAQRRDTGARRSRSEIIDAIDAAAVEVFAHEGLSGASTQLIAKRAGLSKQQLHYYIAGKDELYRRVLQAVVDEWIDIFVLPADPLASPRRVLSDYVRRKLAFSFEQPQRSRLFALEVMRGAPVLRPMLTRFAPRMTTAVALLEGWMAQGRLRRTEPLLVLFHIWALTEFHGNNGEQVSHFTGHAPTDPQWRYTVEQEVLSFVLRALGAR